ncbi:MAG: phosphotransferase family protein [Actinomycetota bacterium]|nr:phosphotransferase family protein [Actinomycetota bacterium]MDA8280547.1 phosphotransferase family protein [Actinomycetota bacterium]
MTTSASPKGTDPMAAEPVEGIDIGPVTAWFEANVDGVVPPLDFTLIAGGRSNLTFAVADAAGHRYALRRPPISHVLPTAHDMAREHRVMSALGPTAVPVPATFGLCTDVAVTGSPFYVMELVDGHILRDTATVEQVLDMAGRWHAGLSLADTLAALHDVDVDAVGLGDFARHDGYIDRQLRRWIGQFRGSVVPGEELPDVVESVHDRLAASVPPQQGTAIVHGDYRLDNVVLGDDGSVRAVLDWEICTLGDPLADLGLLLVYWTDPGDEAALAGVTPTAVPGFPSRQEIADRYAAGSGRDIGTLDFYVAFGYWKLACILQGVYARYAGGAAAGDRTSVDTFATSATTLAERASAVLDGR